MSYKVLARKWRPQKFSEIIGQNHIAKTLQNAIQKKRVGHAYLFVGPRGIGKTTTARIFAKALNCSNPIVDSSIGLEPCGICQSCIEIASGICLDVIEIDGASNNKVEDIRGLRETVPYSPTHGRQYKIYIIDEVHMLTTGAWNALLKTLEEPPSHVKFLFATTEPHKILDTIVSRCQRFDFKRIPVPTIVSQLRKVAVGEKIQIEDPALAIIARAANGGMRDAQSIFDQIIAFCGGEDKNSTIIESDVIEVFGLASSGDLKKLVSALIHNSPCDVLSNLHNLADNGRNLERLYGDLLTYLRNLMIYHHAKNPQQIVELGESEIEDFCELKKESSAPLIHKLLEGMMNFESGLRNYLNKRVFIEVSILRVMHQAHSVSIDDVISGLKSLKIDSSRTPEEAKKSIAKNIDDHDEILKEQIAIKGSDENKAEILGFKNGDEDSKIKVFSPSNIPEAQSFQSSTNSMSYGEGSQPPVVGTGGIDSKISDEEIEVSGKSKNSTHYLKDEIQKETSGIADPDNTLLSTTGVPAEDSAKTNENETSDFPADCEQNSLFRKEVWEMLENHDFVKSVCKIFNGKIVDVRG